MFCFFSSFICGEIARLLPSQDLDGIMERKTELLSVLMPSKDRPMCAQINTPVRGVLFCARIFEEFCKTEKECFLILFSWIRIVVKDLFDQN